MEEKIRKIEERLADHEKRINELENILKIKENKRIIKEKTRSLQWYKKGSTIEKIIILINDGFFRNPKSISEIIKKLAEKDYHFKSSDLTLPLRKIVRRGLLKKIKELPNGTKSKVWLYVRDNES